MGDFGIKISKTGESAFDLDIDKLGFTSEESSLMLIDSTTVSFTAPEGEVYPSGTETYTHNLGYMPLTIAYVQEYGGGKFSSVPYFATTSPFPGTYVDTSIAVYIKENIIEVNWAVNEYLPGEQYPLSGDIDFKVDISIYGFELGSTTD